MKYAIFQTCHFFELAETGKKSPLPCSSRVISEFMPFLYRYFPDPQMHGALSWCIVNDYSSSRAKKCGQETAFAACSRQGLSASCVHLHFSSTISSSTSSGNGSPTSRRRRRTVRFSAASFYKATFPQPIISPSSSTSPIGPVSPRRREIR